MCNITNVCDRYGSTLVNANVYVKHVDYIHTRKLRKFVRTGQPRSQAGNEATYRPAET